MESDTFPVTSIWYFLDSGQQYQGPYSATELQGLYSDGYITDESFFWAEGSDGWTKLSSIPELHSSVVLKTPGVVQSTENSAQDSGLNLQKPKVDGEIAVEIVTESETFEGAYAAGGSGVIQADDKEVAASVVGRHIDDDEGALGQRSSLEDNPDHELRRFEEEVRKAEAEAAAIKAARFGRKPKGASAAGGTGTAGVALVGTQTTGSDALLDRHEEEETNVEASELGGEGFGGESLARGDESALNEDEQGPGSPPEGEQEFTDDDGTVYRWDSARRIWVPQEGILTAEEMSYDAEVMTFEKEDEVLPSVTAAMEEQARERAALLAARQLKEEEEALARRGPKWGEFPNEEGSQAKGEKRSSLEQPPPGDEEGIVKVQKRGKGDKKGKDDGKGPQKAAAQPPPEAWFDLKVNTSVYVTGLPTDTTVEEVEEVFSRCGIIKEDVDTKKPRIKLYQDKVTGWLKGDGLVTYLKEPSVDLALKILDGSLFRPTDRTPITVTLAKFEQKGDVFIKKNTSKQKKKKLKQTEQKSLGWGGFDDMKKSKAMTILLKHMFTGEEVAADSSLLTDIEADVAEECGRLGTVERLKVYENHPEGLVLVRFKDRAAGLKCMELMNGRWFGGRQIEAVEDDGKTNHALVRDEAAEARRLEQFGAELEAGIL